MKPHEAYNKALKAGKRLPEIEHIILTDSQPAFNYAMFIIKARWEEAEDIILTDLHKTYQYARYVIKGKLPNKMHNRMLLSGLSKDLINYYWVKQYFEFIERRENIKKLTVDQLYDKLVYSEDLNELQETISDAAERMNELSDDYIRNLIKYATTAKRYVDKNRLVTRKEIKYMLTDVGVKIPESPQQ